MGNDLGTGIQGAVYRYQVTGYGGSLFTIMKEMTYVTSGTYTGKTAVSVILWFTGTLVLTVLTIYSLIKISRTDARQIRWLGIGLTITVLLYLGSCISQYGLFFSGPAGISLPVGIILLGLFTGAMQYLLQGSHTTG